MARVGLGSQSYHFLIKSFNKTINLVCLASRARFPGFGQCSQSYHFLIKSFTKITNFGYLASGVRLRGFGQGCQTMAKSAQIIGKIGKPYFFFQFFSFFFNFLSPPGSGGIEIPAQGTLRNREFRFPDAQVAERIGKN